MAHITGLMGISFMFVLSFDAAAQTVDAGGRGLALSNAVVAVPALPFEASNPALRTAKESTRAAFAVGRAHTLSEFQYLSSLLVIPIRTTGITFTLDSFGFDAYRRITASIGVTRCIQTDVCGGVRMSGRRVSVSGYGSRTAAAPSLGWVAVLTPRIIVGGSWRHAGSPLQSKYRILSQEMILGFHAQVSQLVRLLGAAVREVGSGVDVRLGAEYVVVPPLTVRLGTATDPDRVSFGFGLQLHRAALDLGVSIHPVLGPSFAVTAMME